jgi:hypothetical protein
MCPKKPLGERFLLRKNTLVSRGRSKKLMKRSDPTDQVCGRFEQPPVAGLTLWLLSARLSLSALADSVR